ncbi:hypothetical protein DYB30_009439 [Aphanomyces astaci]|uniref:WRKY19-like zinc finger domain-containing protein n=1 Tax=Aphanomyces astaci TaxID=112090 RepID=A0A397DX90_APHAT|nr:hypothetical protein DYB30_009439 [Aphanomyces astaci]
MTTQTTTHTTTTCVFKDCTQPVHSSFPSSSQSKCLFHRNRSQCEAPDCSNQAYARNRCVRHGAKQTCVADGCTQNRRLGLFCSKHADADSKKRCSVTGCDKLPHVRGLCVRHGGGRLCKAPDCTSHARIGLLCARHFHGLTSPSTSPRQVVAVAPLNIVTSPPIIRTSPTYRAAATSTTSVPMLIDLAATMGMSDTLDWAILSDLVADSTVTDTHADKAAAIEETTHSKCWSMHCQQEQPHNKYADDLEIWDALFYVM